MNKSGVNFALYLISEIGNNDVKMHQNRQEGADACLGLFVILYRQTGSAIPLTTTSCLSLTQFGNSL